MTQNTFMIGATNGSLQTLPVTPGLTIYNAIKTNGLDRVFKNYEVIFTRPGQAPGVVVKDLGVLIEAGDMIVISEEVKGAQGFGRVTFKTDEGDKIALCKFNGDTATVRAALMNAKVPTVGTFVNVATETELSLSSPVEPGMVIEVRAATPVAVVTLTPAERTDRITFGVREVAEEPEKESYEDYDEDETETQEEPEAGWTEATAAAYADELSAAKPPVAEVKPEPKYEADLRIMSPEPAELTALATSFFEEATSLREFAADALHQAAKLELKSKDFNARAADITAALETFATAKSAVVALGVPVPKDPEPEVETVADPREDLLSELLEAMSYKDLVQLAKTRGVNAKGKKSELVARLMGEEQ